MTKIDLDELEKQAQEAQKGTWAVSSAPNPGFIVRSPHTIPKLIEVIRIQREALEKYADESFDWGYDHSWNGNCDYGGFAREALLKVKEILG